MTARLEAEKEEEKHHSPAAAIRNGEAAQEVPLSVFNDDIIERV